MIEPASGSAWSFWRSQFPFIPAILSLLAASIVVALLEMLHPLILRWIIDHVLLRDDKAVAARLLSLHLAAAGFVLVLLLSVTIDAFRLDRQRRLNLQMALDLRRQLFSRLLRLPLHALSKLRTGGILSRLGADVDQASGLAQLGIISPGVALMRVLIALLILYVINWQLAIVATAVIPGVVLASLLMMRRVRPIYRSFREDMTLADSRAAEAFAGIRAVRVSCAEMREERAYFGDHHLAVRKELLAHRYEILLWTVWSLVLSGTTLAVIWFGGFLHLSGRASIGDILAFQWYILMLVNPVWRIVESFSDVQRALAAMDRINEVLEISAEEPDPPGAMPAPQQVRELRLESVSFAYPGGGKVLHNLSLTVAAGTVVALVGRSGAGKSTLTHLLARFYDPSSGRILVNGMDLRQVRRRSYRSLLAVVPQETLLFDAPIRDNIAYARPDASEDEIISAARRAHAHEFISLLPDQYETAIGERGVKLSGGQRQRIAIARAILADPQILILDEATSSLDAESEALVRKGLVELLNGRTTFLVAHRLSTILAADLIVVLDHGRIMQMGSHAELAGRSGQYQDMIQQQVYFGDALPPACVPTEPRSAISTVMHDG